MFRKVVETSLTPHVTITTCRGNLTVKGDGEKKIALSVHGSGGEVGWDREGETLTLTLPSSATLVCPSGTTLTIEHVLGNLRVEGISGPAAIGGVHGNTTLRAVGPVDLGNAHGNLRARDVADELRGKDVKGNASIRGVDGILELEQVAGNLFAEGLQGGMTVETVRGNARLGPPYIPNTTFRLRGYGNLTALVPVGASLRLTLRGGGKARSLVPGLVLEEVDGETTGIIGSGETELEAEMNGDVTVRTCQAGDSVEMSAGWDELGAHIEWQLNDALARMATSLQESLGQVDGEWVRHRVDRATEQARRRAEQAAERARMRADSAERRWRRASGQRPTAKRQQQATDKERLHVLRMVREGKITPDEASELLAAIEGR
ncbi:MAG: hypothetical protein PVH41_12195 [Anaerolineae bacterium]